MRKLKMMFCVLFGHSKVVSLCFGYVNCARCKEQIGDTLAGVFNLKDKCIIGCGCSLCEENYRKMRLAEKLFARRK